MSGLGGWLGTLVQPIADAFMQVGVFVAVMAAVAAWARWRYGETMSSLLTRHRGAGPAIGAVLGVSPGCAGALLVMPLFAAGEVSFGTVIAALAATMGDSSWVIIAGDPQAALWVHAVLLVTGLVTGYAVDAVGFSPRLRHGARARTTTAAAGPGRSLGAAAAPRSGVLAATGPAGAVLLGTAAVGLLVAVPVAFQLVNSVRLTAVLPGTDLYLVIGAVGTGLAALVVWAERRRPAVAGLGAALRDSAADTARIVLWVAGVYLAWQLVETGTGFDGSQLPLVGMLGVLAGALVGLIPGCAVQITFTGLYLTGAVPASALLANAVSQDGDALIPLLAGQRTAAACATLITTVPAVAVGTLALTVLGP